MAITNSHPNRNAPQYAARHRVNSTSKTAATVSDPTPPGADTVEPSLPIVPIKRTGTPSPTPLARELTNSAGTSPLPELLTLPEICAFLKVKPSYIYSLTATDRIPHRKFGGTLRFVKAEILQWIDRGRRGPRMSEPPRSDS